MSKVVIFGSKGWAQYLHYILTHDSDHQVVGFTVDDDYLEETSLFGLPIVPFSQVPSVFPPAEFKMLVGLSYQKMNQLREAKYHEAKAKGYELISFVASTAQVVPDVAIGDNSLILENCVVQPFARIGNNVSVCSSSVIGHHSILEDHAFVSPGAVLLGVVTIGSRCLIGAGATIIQNVQLGPDCLIGMGVALTQSAKAGSVYINPPAELMPQTSEELMPFLSWS